jgi:Putative zinc-finger
MSVHPVESLSAFLDDELGDAERRGVEAHLAACPTCARHLRELAAVDALARDLPPAGAPDGYLETLPGRVRRRIRADRPASARPWVWPLAAGLALAVLAPIVLLQQRARYSPADRAAEATVPPAAPAMTVAPTPPAPATAGPSVATPQDERRRIDSGVAEDEGTVARPQASSERLRREAAPAKMRDAFAVPPPAARANESDRGAQVASGASAGTLVDAPPAAAPPAEEVALAAAGRRKEEPAPSSLKKADAPRPKAAEAKRGEDPEKAFLENASLPASTPEEARLAREAWRRFVSLHPAGPRADEGRVRFIEAAVAVFRLTGDAEDRAIAEREGRAYLALPAAPQASRVRDAQRLLERDR